MKRSAPVTDTRALQLSRRCYLAAIFILFAGLLAAAWIYLHASDSPDDNRFDSKTYQLQVEHIGGKGMLLTIQLEQWFANLWQGRQLALTLLLSAILLAGFCMLLGHFFASHQQEEAAGKH